PVTFKGSADTSTSGSGLKIPGSSTCTSCSRRGATTMKMMSRTSTTSTSGVTLMSGRTAPAWRRLGDALTESVLHAVCLVVAPPLEQVDQFAGGCGEPRLLACDLLREVVEGEYRRDRDCEPERRFDERLADAGG